MIMIIFQIMSDVTQSTMRSVVMEFNDSATLAALPRFGLYVPPVVQANTYKELPIPSNKYKVGKTFALVLRYCEDVVQKVISGVSPEDVQEMIRRKFMKRERTPLLLDSVRKKLNS